MNERHTKMGYVRGCLKLSDVMKGVVYQAACTKAHLKEETANAGKKRKRENLRWTRQTCCCVNDSMLVFLRHFLRIHECRYSWSYLEDVEDSHDKDLEMFLDLASEEEIKVCFCQFCAATSNTSLRIHQCVVCAQELGAEQGGMSNVLDDPSVQNLLQPSHIHLGQVLWHGALVLGEEICKTDNAHFAWICNNYEVSLWKGKVPWFSFINDLWIGDIPCQLTALTIPEQLLIAHYYPWCYMIKLYPQGGCHLSQELLQRGMKENISLYELNTKYVVRMLEGQVKPNPACSLASVLAITFVGSKSLPKCYNFLSLFLSSHHCSIKPFHFPFWTFICSHA